MQTLIKLDNISALYDGKAALSNVSLQISDRDYLGVIGPNGGGKTTLMRIILGLMKPSAGKVTYFKDGQPTDNITIGYLPQYNQIDKKFPISVYDTVLSGLNSQKKPFRPFSKAQRQQAQDTITKMELGGLEDRAIGTLSGGQIQRTLLARAIVSQPKALILDEPNTYVDKRFQEQLYEMLRIINQNCAVIIVSHDIASIIQNAKHVACINHTMHYHAGPNFEMETIERHFLKI